MRIAVALVAVAAGCSPALAFDTSKLPATCQSTIAEMQGQKARFSQLDVVMAKSRKAGDTTNFCGAARETLTIIMGQSVKLDDCVGELAGDRVASPAVVGEMTQLKSYYRSMLQAAKKPENDRFKCGLADM